MMGPDRVSASPRGQTDGADALPAWLIILLATACGLIAANVYYAQPLVGPISLSLGMLPQTAGLIVTMTQIGYGIGLLLIVPLGDLVENRRLTLAILCLAVLSLACAALVTDEALFLAAALLIGIGSVAVQVLVPYAAHLAPEVSRGRVVGNVMSGLMLGIMLARPVASLVADALSWRAVFVISALLMTGLAAVLRLALPLRRPAPGLHYGALLRSMAWLGWRTPVLQRRSFYHACLFGTFGLFWTTVPLLLADSFHLSQSGIALFALAGVAGAISAPIAGRIADRGWSRPATGMAMIAVAGACALGYLGASGSQIGLTTLVVAAILLDLGVAANFVLGQRAIFSLSAEYRSRLNGLYMATFFLSGAACSALGTWTYAVGGWSLSMAAGAALSLLGLVGLVAERPCPQGERASAAQPVLPPHSAIVKETSHD
jgi:predicted MFS family arabinose efflux permease